MNKKKKQYKLTVKVFVIAGVLGAAFWIFDAFIQKFFFTENLRILMFTPPETFLDALFLNMSFHTLFVRISYLAACLLGAFITILILKKAKVSEERFHGYIREAPISIFIADKEGNIREANPAASTLTGYDEKELVNMKADFLHPVLMAADNGIRKTALDSSYRHIIQIEHTIRKKDTNLIIAILDAVQLPDENILIFATDITRLKQTERQLEKNVREIEVLLHELNHRVKNNLNIIIGLINLQADKVKTKEQANEAFVKIRDRIFAISMIHERLQQSVDYSEIDMKEYIQSLADNLNTLHGKRRININLKLDKIKLNIKTAIPCGLILNELITNSIKHAFVNKKNGILRIIFRMGKNGNCRITVSDNGPGLSADYDQYAAHSLGFQLIIALAQQISGRLKYEYEEGAKFTVDIPIL